MSATPYGQRDTWHDAAGLDEARARGQAARLELRGRAAEEVETRAAYLDLLDIAPGDRVLEVGCGVVLRELARRVGVFDNDGDSLIIAHPDRLLTRRIVAACSDHQQVTRWLVRRLPGLFHEAGLRDIRLRAFTAFGRDLQGCNGLRTERAAAIAVEVGAIS
jgi:hypothetical protein